MSARPITTKTKLTMLVCLWCTLWLSHCALANPTSLQVPPRLVLQITVDQFAGTQLDHYRSQHRADGGFSWLISHGLWYDNAHHPHATTETAVGHTTLATGAGPAVHGIVANYWWDRQQQKMRYALEDHRYPLLANQRSDRTAYGRSPAAILVPSFADSLAIATRGQAKRFAVSTKDRGAIPLAGQMGKAFWFDTFHGRYLTSRYYAQTLPQWLNDWQKQHPSEAYLNQQWQPLLPCHQYQHCHNQDNPFQPQADAFHAQFPHPFGKAANASFYENITRSPISDKLTLSLAKQILKTEKLGKGKVTDYLSVSLSATDAIGHHFGPHSYESEDNFLRLDRELGNFFRFIDKTVGLNNVLIVFSADHGIPPATAWMRQHRYPASEKSINLAVLPTVKAFFAEHQLDVNKAVIAAMPDVYVNDRYLHAHSINKNEVIDRLSQDLAHQANVAFAVKTSEVLHNCWQHPYLTPRLHQQVYDGRSGDLYVITPPYDQITTKPYAIANHGSPWLYDTHVPIIFAHPTLKQRRIHRAVSTADIAVTLSALTQAPPPAAATGKVLQEFE